MFINFIVYSIYLLLLHHTCSMMLVYVLCLHIAYSIYNVKSYVIQIIIIEVFFERKLIIILKNNYVVRNYFTCNCRKILMTKSINICQLNTIRIQNTGHNVVEFFLAMVTIFRQDSS